MEKTKQRSLWIWVISLVAITFGLLTIKEGGAVLFGSAAARITAGDYVPFVLWFNFIAGFTYVIAGIGLWLQRRWAVGLAVTIVVATLFTFIAFGVHMYSGGAYELRTVVAMSVRSLTWIMIAAFAWRVIGIGITSEEA
jgi:hypothetical protein